MRKKRPEVFPAQDDSELSFQPLTLFTLICSVAAILNSQARYLESNLDSLKETGGYNATTDCEQAAGFLLAVVESNMEKFMSMKVEVPMGWGYVAMSYPSGINEESGELPF
jgi:hypothetical protein